MYRVVIGGKVNDKEYLIKEFFVEEKPKWNELVALGEANTKNKFFRIENGRYLFTSGFFIKVIPIDKYKSIKELLCNSIM